MDPPAGQPQLATSSSSHKAVLIAVITTAIVTTLIIGLFFFIWKKLKSKIRADKLDAPSSFRYDNPLLDTDIRSHFWKHSSGTTSFVYATTPVKQNGVFNGSSIKADSPDLEANTAAIVSILKKDPILALGDANRTEGDQICIPRYNESNLAGGQLQLGSLHRLGPHGFRLSTMSSSETETASLNQPILSPDAVVLQGSAVTFPSHLSSLAPSETLHSSHASDGSARFSDFSFDENFNFTFDGSVGHGSSEGQLSERLLEQDLSKHCTEASVEFTAGRPSSTPEENQTDNSQLMVESIGPVVTDSQLPAISSKLPLEAVSSSRQNIQKTSAMNSAAFKFSPQSVPPLPLPPALLSEAILKQKKSAAGPEIQPSVPVRSVAAAFAKKMSEADVVAPVVSAQEIFPSVPVKSVVAAFATQACQLEALPSSCADIDLRPSIPVKVVACTFENIHAFEGVATVPSNQQPLSSEDHTSESTKFNASRVDSLPDSVESLKTSHTQGLVHAISTMALVNSSADVLNQSSMQLVHTPRPDVSLSSIVAPPWQDTNDVIHTQIVNDCQENVDLASAGSSLQESDLLNVNGAFCSSNTAFMGTQLISSSSSSDLSLSATLMAVPQQQMLKLQDSIVSDRYTETEFSNQMFQAHVRTIISPSSIPAMQKVTEPSVSPAPTSVGLSTHNEGISLLSPSSMHAEVPQPVIDAPIPPSPPLIIGSSMPTSNPSQRVPSPPLLTTTVLHSSKPPPPAPPPPSLPSRRSAVQSVHYLPSSKAGSQQSEHSSVTTKAPAPPPPPPPLPTLKNSYAPPPPPPPLPASKSYSSSPSLPPPPPPPPPPLSSKKLPPAPPLPPGKGPLLPRPSAGPLSNGPPPPPVSGPRFQTLSKPPPSPQQESLHNLQKLKPLHWDKVRADPSHSMVWDRLKAGSFELNEAEIAALFGTKPSTVKAVAKAPPPTKRKGILDSKKAQNIAIQLRALKASTQDICDALLEGANMKAESLDVLVKMAPTQEEEKALLGFSGDRSELDPAERFLKSVLEIPNAFQRLQAMQFRASFKDDMMSVQDVLKVLEAACVEIRENRLFLKLLEAVLKTGNRMNKGTNRGEAEAFKLDALLRLSDVKSADGKTTLLHYVAEEIIKSEGKKFLQVLNNDGNLDRSSIGNLIPSDIPKMEDDVKRKGIEVVWKLCMQLQNVKNAAGVDADVLNQNVSKLANGLTLIQHRLKTTFQEQAESSSVFATEDTFCSNMEAFSSQGESDIARLKEEVTRVFDRVKQVTAYFHGNGRETHPLRLFIIVRDFLGMLEKVCKDLARPLRMNLRG